MGARGLIVEGVHVVRPGRYTETGELLELPKGSDPAGRLRWPCNCLSGARFHHRAHTCALFNLLIYRASRS